ncbi:MAG: hypothetical protein V4617_02255 [Gemmatimonadota bacterium]
MSGHAGAARWLTIQDELLRGIAHTLSNRVATIDAAAYMLQFDGANIAAQSAVLRGEGELLEALVFALRAIPRRSDAAAEPVMPSDAVHAALTLHAHHNELRDIACETRIEPDVQPVFVDPLALQHALLVGLTAARSAAGTGGLAIVQVTGTDDSVQFSVTARDVVHAAADGGSDDAAAIGWLLSGYHGECTVQHGGSSFRVPTLGAARRAGR